MIENDANLGLKEFSKMRTSLAKRVWFRDSTDYDMITDLILRTHDRMKIPSIIITGPVCSGKTELAKALADLVRDGRIYNMASVKSLSDSMEVGMTPILDGSVPSWNTQDLYDLIMTGGMVFVTKDLPPKEIIEECLLVKMQPAPEGWIRGA